MTFWGQFETKVCDQRGRSSNLGLTGQQISPPLRQQPLPQIAPLTCPIQSPMRPTPPCTPINMKSFLPANHNVQKMTPKSYYDHNHDTLPKSIPHHTKNGARSIFHAPWLSPYWPNDLGEKSKTVFWHKVSKKAKGQNALFDFLLWPFVILPIFTGAYHLKVRPICCV